MHDRNMEKDVADDFSGSLKKLMVSLMTANRSEAMPNLDRAGQQARELFKGGVERFGTDETLFNRIFASESFPQLQMIFDIYAKSFNQNIEKAIKDEMSGNTEKAFLALFELVQNPPAYFARRLYESMKGVGTDETSLIRILALRSEVDMVEIKKEFLNKYNKSLEERIKSETSGDFFRGLQALIH